MSDFGHAAASDARRVLPAIEGPDVLGRWRPRGVTGPVLVLSALGLARDRDDGPDAGAEDYLSKPFDIDELLARIRALLRRHGEGRFVVVEVLDDGPGIASDTLPHMFD